MNVQTSESWAQEPERSSTPGPSSFPGVLLLWTIVAASLALLVPQDWPLPSNLPTSAAVAANALAGEFAVLAVPLH